MPRDEAKLTCFVETTGEEHQRLCFMRMTCFYYSPLGDMYVSTLKEVDTAVGFMEYQIQLKVEFNLNVEDKDT